MSSVVFLPAVSSEEDLADLLARISWYLYPFRAKISRIRIWLDSVDIARGIRIPERFDTTIGSRAEAIAPLIHYSPWTPQRIDDACEAIGSAACVFLWRADAPILREPKITAALQHLRAAGRCYSVDAEQTRMEGSFYLWAGLNTFENERELEATSKRRFDAFLRKLGHNKRAYVFGTGPSLSGFAAAHNFSDGVCFAANSMVKDEALLDHLKPVAIVASDPIFHAGCSRYSEVFRAHLVRAMRAHNAYFITSIRDYSVFASWLPTDLRDKIIGVPFKSGAPFNADLSRSFYVQPLPNILTLLLLPLAGAVADQIAIVGCDGRPLEQNQYFWAHDKAAQFNHEMDNIKLVHPAFFTVNYDDYYSEHCRNVEIAAREFERLGKIVRSLTPSYVPALAARSGALPPPPKMGPNNAPPDLDTATPALARTRLRFVAIDPDGRNGSGHFLSHDARLWEAAQRADVDFTLLARSDVDEEALPSTMHAVKCLTVHSWEVRPRDDGSRAPKAAKFAEELSLAVDAHLSDPTTPAVLYMYCGSLEHAAAIEGILSKHPHISAHVTLFWQYAATYGDARYFDQWLARIAAMASNPRLALSVPTSKIQADLRKHFGVSLRVAPHPSTTFSDDEAKRYAQGTPHRVGTRPVVLFPGGARVEKGAKLTGAAVKRLAADGEFDLIIRANPDYSDQAALAALNEIPEVGVKVCRDALDDLQFIDFLARGDIIVCPYLDSAFSRRTSGLVIDAMIMGRPIVALKSTWLGELAEQEAFGIAAEASADGIVDAVKAVAARFDEFSEGAAKARKRYLTHHSWASLVSAAAMSRTVPTELAPASGGEVSKMPNPLLCDAPASQPAPQKSAATGHDLILGKPRSAGAHIDETAVVARMLSNRTGRDHVMIDVGAHFGTSASYFHKFGWRIFCFEPDSNNREKLLAKYRDAPNVVIDCRAVAEAPKTSVAFFTSPESTGISSLGAFHHTHRESARVDVTTVAAIVEDHQLSAVAFLKIDVEGFDFSVLRGVPWQKMKPDVIECEFEDAKTLPLGHSWRDLANFLRDQGYSVYISEWHPIVRYGVRHDWRRVLPMDADDLPHNAWGNLLAFRDDPGLPALKAAFDALLRLTPAAPVAARPAPAAAPAPVAAPPTPAPPLVTSSTAPPAPEAVRFYAPLGDALRQHSPQMFTLARFGKKTLGSLWRRRAVTAPISLLFAAWVLAGFLPAVAAWHWLIWGGAAFTFLFSALTYLALRTRQFMERMIHETQTLGAALQTAEHAFSLKLAADASLAVKSTDALRKRLVAGQAQLDARMQTLDTRVAANLSDIRSLIAASQEQIAGEVVDVRSDMHTDIAAARAQLSGQIDDVHASIAALQADASALAHQFDTRTDALAAEAAKIEEALNAVAALEADLTRESRELNGRAEALSAETARVAQEFDAAAKLLQQDIIARVAASERQIAALDAAARRADTAIVAQGEALTKQAEIAEQRMADRADVSERHAEALAREVGALGRNAEALAKESAHATFNNASWYQRFNRRISEEQLHVLKRWAANTPAQPTREAMGYAAHRACIVEQRMQGRLATSIEDVLLRSLAAMSVPRRKINVLEIGTLFGIGAGIMYDMMAPHYDEVHVTLIDPLDGYYETNRLDILTGQPITERTLRQNLAQVDLKGDKLTLIKHLSTDPEALERAAERRYDVLVIDGDHSYEGVKADFELYAPLVRRGGIIIFDDYGAKDWPDVARYVDSEVSQVGNVGRVGHEWRTCAYRKRGSSGKKRKRT